jgi:hypothetical protein
MLHFGATGFRFQAGLSKTFIREGREEKNCEVKTNIS